MAEADVTSPTSDGKPQKLPAFLSKMYEMVDDSSTNHLISWGSSSETFVVWNVEDFSTQLLSKYFKRNNFSNFIRQLNLYGFKKVNPKRWEFANKVGFVRGEPQLLKNIHRKRQDSKGTIDSQETIDAPLLTYQERYIYWVEVEKLKREKQLQFGLLDYYETNQLQIYGKKYALAGTYQGVLKKQRDISLSSFLGFFVTDLDGELEKCNNKKKKYVMPTIEENEIFERLEFELSNAERFVQEIELAVEMRAKSLALEMKNDEKTEEEKITNDLFWEMLLKDDDWMIWTEGLEGFGSQI